MLFSSTPVLPLAALAASLALAPLASAEIHYGATGVEYAKRFTPSSGLCFYQCPTLTYSDPDTHASMTAQPLNPQGTTASGSSVTTCSYQVTWVPGPGNTVVYSGTCAYDSSTGALSGSALPQGNIVALTQTCSPQAVWNSPSCEVKKRTLSELERQVRNRQYNPKKVRGANERLDAHLRP